MPNARGIAVNPYIVALFEQLHGFALPRRCLHCVGEAQLGFRSGRGLLRSGRLLLDHLAGLLLCFLFVFVQGRTPELFQRGRVLLEGERRCVEIRNLGDVPNHKLRSALVFAVHLDLCRHLRVLPDDGFHPRGVRRGLAALAQAVCLRVVRVGCVNEHPSCLLLLPDAEGYSEQAVGCGVRADSLPHLVDGAATAPREGQLVRIWTQEAPIPRAIDFSYLLKSLVTREKACDRRRRRRHRRPTPTRGGCGRIGRFKT
mmetsp:Transcript_30815/g.89570  ORF Transcript_30815/g.89570 Transcript_30815/m.89570 type:complete len:257 (+) Transcript_30815:787-1557(+)